MTDREMLELAAKAAGMDWCAYYPDKIDSCDLCLQPNGLRWNPLTDDGDALRLAVKLRIEISPEAFGLGRAETRTKNSGWITELHSDNAGDQYAATRRAIVRAAAKIGAAQK